MPGRDAVEDELGACIILSTTLASRRQPLAWCSVLVEVDGVHVSKAPICHIVEKTVGGTKLSLMIFFEALSFEKIDIFASCCCVDARG